MCPKMVDGVGFPGLEAKIVQELTVDGHVPERITAERWKAIAALCRDPAEQEKFFENFLDTTLALVLRCTACGRAFLLLRLAEGSIFVADEDGDQIEIDNEPPCPEKE